MGEEDSLIFLANVALRSRHEVRPVCRKRKDPRKKQLRIFHLNGTDVAEINDLKSLSISMIFKIFIEKFEDVKLRCTVYVCNYGVKYRCNTRFMDVKENKVQRVEHLIQCHLLEHLMKTKSGSLITIPKKSVESMKTDYLKSATEAKVSGESKVNNLLPMKNVAQSSNHGDLDAKIPLVEVDSNLDCNTEAKQTSKSGLCIRDHSYASSQEKKSFRSVIPSKDYQMIKSSNVRIEEIYPLNGEPSEELTSFMMYETLHQPVNIFIMEGKNLIVEKLPIVGSEVEVVTNLDLHSSINSFTPSDYLTEKSQNFHRRKKHCGVPKERIKRRIISDEGAMSVHETKMIKQTQLSTILNDANNNRLVELKENFSTENDVMKANDISILKTALTKNASVKRPIVTISNVWNNINVQYI